MKKSDPLETTYDALPLFIVCELSLWMKLPTQGLTFDCSHALRTFRVASAHDVGKMPRLAQKPMSDHSVDHAIQRRIFVEWEKGVLDFNAIRSSPSIPLLQDV